MPRASLSPAEIRKALRTAKRWADNADKNHFDLYGRHLKRWQWAQEVMEGADKLMGGHGVEAISPGELGPPAYEPAATYVNMGDTYDCTVVYDCEQRRFYVTSWGDWVETAERAGRYSFE